MEKWQIGVFTSIDAGLGVDLAVARELGIPTIQIHAPHQGNRGQDAAEAILAKVDSFGIKITAVFGGFDGESYADIPTVVDTVGLVPKSTRESRLAEMKEISDFTKRLNCSVIALHLGFVPHDTSDPDYGAVVAMTKDLCQYAAKNGQALHLETGQETAEALVQFIEDCESPNLFVNFDPANMILYGAGDPIEALQVIGPSVKSVHCKDAKWSDKPGITWGEETRLGDGEVNMKRYLETLDKIGYTGPLTIEREIPQEPERQKTEIGHAVTLLNSVKSELM
ncbi:MAG: sugar phosphate isomerase/epimerase family protein [Planctomycetota bacterium]